MKILILGSVALPVPPPMQGGTERIAYFQAKGLAQRGHEVTLVAAHGSKTDGTYKLVEIGGGDTVAGAVTESKRTEFTEGSRNLRKESVYLSQVTQYILDHGKEFDVILNNMRAGESLFVPAAKAVGVPYTTVMHLPIFSELAAYFVATKTPVITISNAQRNGFGEVPHAGTVFNCVEPELLALTNQGKQPQGYLISLGSIAPHKNQLDAIHAAKKVGKKLILAGKIGNREYFETQIRPHIDNRSIELKGEMSLAEKADLLAGADALLFPILWPEPFGLVMIEAMAAGTPIIAYAHGAVPEVVRDGVTGYIVDQMRDEKVKSRWQVGEPGVAGLVAAINRLESIDRSACRRHVEMNFTVSAMIDSLEDAVQVVRAHS